MTDNSIVEIVKKSVEADIEKRVYEKIKDDLLRLKFIGGTLGILVVLLVLLHQQVFTLVVNLGSKALEDRIKTQVDGQLKALDTAHAKMETTREFFSKDMDSLLLRMRQERDNIAALRDDVDKRKKEVNDLVITLNETSDTTRERISAAQSEAIARAREQQDAMFATIAALQKAIVADLGKPASSVETNQVNVQPATRTDRNPIVFFQFAGFDRKEAEKISTAIKTAGWKIPGEERTPLAVKTNEIRYAEADRAAADRLKIDAEKALQGLSPPINLQLKPSSQVKPGFIEIWIFKS